MDVSDCRELLNAAMRGERASPYVPAVREFLAAEAASEAAAVHTARQPPAADDGAPPAAAGGAAQRARGDLVVRALASCRFCPTASGRGGGRPNARDKTSCLARVSSARPASPPIYASPVWYREVSLPFPHSVFHVAVWPKMLCYVCRAL